MPTNSISKEEIEVFAKMAVKKAYLEGIQYSIDVLTDLKNSIESKEAPSPPREEKRN